MSLTTMMIHFNALNLNLKTILSQRNQHLVKQYETLVNQLNPPITSFRAHVLLTTGTRRMPLLLLQVLSNISGPSFTCLLACAGSVLPTYSAGVHWFATAFTSLTLSVRLFLGEIQRLVERTLVGTEYDTIMIRIRREVLVEKYTMRELDLLVGECRSTHSLALATHSCWTK